MSKTSLVSIITPAYQCGRYIRQCIESVRAQGYDHFEHIIADGGSTDGTVEILREYPHVRWLSEPDEGEGHALNKALALARGDMVGWLNADDYYLPGTLRLAVETMDPARGIHVVYGKTDLVDEEGILVRQAVPINPVTLTSLVRWHRGLGLFPQAMFFSRELVDDLGSFRQQLYYGLDYEWWLRSCGKGYGYHYVDHVFAAMRCVRTDAKSGASCLEQHKVWMELCLPYVAMLPGHQRALFWADYWYRYRIRRILSPAKRWVKSLTRRA